jgi:TolA-binding protein
VHYIKGNRDRSREFLDRVIRQYPESSAAGLAKEFIQQNL